MVQQIRGVKATVSHVYSWKEHDNGQALTLKSYNSMVEDSAKSCESIDEILAGVKGQLNARNARARGQSK